MVKAEMRRSKYEYEKDLTTKIKTDSKLFWSYVRSKQKTKGKLWQLETENGTLTNDSLAKAEVLNSYQVFLKQKIQELSLNLLTEFLMKF